MEKLNPKNRDMIAKKILEEIEATEWDEMWDETFASPESQAFSAKQREEVIAEHLAGETILYTGGSLAKLFQQEV